MSYWFLTCALGFMFITPMHLLSIEHERLASRFGVARGRFVGKILGSISGWMELLLLVGLWASPQPRFVLPGPTFSIPILGYRVGAVSILLSVPLLALATWLSMWALIEMSREVGMTVADTHAAPASIVQTGPYSLVRHPQYLGGAIAHVGGTLLFGAVNSLYFTPLYLVFDYIMCWGEERGLARQFGRAYEDYRKKVPMFLPRP